MKKYGIAALVIIIFLIGSAWYLESQSHQGVFDTALKPSQTVLDTSSQNKAPEFTGITHWLNSDPLTLEKLKGKVVLIDFWTYSCINCIRTLPYVTALYEKYKDQGLVIIGVHTPEFAFEKDTNNVTDALKRFNITYPVAQDNEYGTWNAYDNHYWPAHYLIDQSGNIVYTHFGEGEYEKMEENIKTLLNVSSTSTVAGKDERPLGRINAPEMYLGLARLQYFSSPEKSVSEVASYTAPSTIPSNTFALQGKWKFSDEDVVLAKDSGVIKLNFDSGKAYMVAESPDPVDMTVIIDGKTVGTVTVTGSRLYTLFESEDYKGHILELHIPKPGFKIFTFTFG